MSSTVALGAIVAGVVATAGLAMPFSAECMEDRKGLELEGRLGPSFCVERDGARCEIDDAALETGFGGGGYLGLRPLSFLSIGVDVGVYSFTYDNDRLDIGVHTTQAMLELRLSIPFGLIEPFAKAGVGYLSLVEKGAFQNGDGYEREYSWGNFKFGGGLTLFLLDSDKIGNIGLGLDFDIALHRPTRWKECKDGDCEKGEVEDDMDPVVGLSSQLNLHFRWIIPVF